MSGTEKDPEHLRVLIQPEEVEDDPFGLGDLDFSDSSSGLPTPKTDLAKTAKAFDSRMQRLKRKQQDEALTEEKETRERHMLLLEALLNIRNSVVDLCRVNLGDRFSLQLIADDWQGWPRSTVKLVDSIFADKEYPYFCVKAADRAGKAFIEVIYEDPLKPVKIEFTKRQDLKTLPITLRKCARSYLDIVGDLVLEAEREYEFSGEEDVLKKKNLQDVKGDASDETQLTGDLFSDELKDDIFEALPELESINVLPDYPEKK